jgi:hypothetical protein
MASGKLTKLLDKVANKNKAEQNRSYIGASSIGSDCYRRIWYEYQNTTTNIIPAKSQRIFMVGKKLENMILDLLDQTKLTVVRPHAQNHYLEYFDDDHPFIRGHCDAIILNPETILEIKTAKDASFKKFKKESLRKWNPQYYDQLQTYMGMSKIKKAIILVFNKDNSEFWDEEVKFDAARYETLKQKAIMIAESKIPPPKINGSPLFYLCRTCKFREECHK